MTAPTGAIVIRCDGCGKQDDHPKWHYGAETYHHDCAPYRLIEDVTSFSDWQRNDDGELFLASRVAIDPKKLHPQTAQVLAIRELAEKGTRGEKLAKLIKSARNLAAKGGASGIDATTAAAILTEINGGAAFAITGPLKVLFLTAVRATATGTDTEWASGGSYVAGTGQPVTFGAATAGAPSTQNSNVAVTQTNCPAATWAGNRIQDSSGTPKVTFWGTITGGSKTVNAGDTCTIPSGSLQTQLG